MTRARIADYGFLADGHSAALVDRAGSVNWWCPTRFDGPSVFGRILDDDAGHWAIRPASRFSSERAYLTGTLVLRTIFTTSTGTVAVTDALALEAGARGHDIGLRSPRILARLVQGLSGEVRMRLHYRPRFGYGRSTASFSWDNGSLVAASDAGRQNLRADATLTVADGAAWATFTIRAGETRHFVLSGESDRGPAPAPSVDAAALIDGAVRGWRSLLGLHDYGGPYPQQVRSSALVLQGLTYRPSGAVVAAASTSLPEKPGGGRNYDYRFVWVRDFSFTLTALGRAACSDEVDRQFEWMARATGVVDSAPVPIMYDVRGERHLSERRLDHLRGYDDSRPVLIGNDAWRQRQNDVVGEIISAAWMMRERLDPFRPHVRQLLVTMADRAARDWRLPDAGMWEARDREEHHVSSKVQCWTALDRAVRFGTRLASPFQVAQWAATRDQIRAAVLAEAWSERGQAFTGVLGSDELDASVLLMPLVGFLPASDPRMRSTVRTLRTQLGDGDLLRRWDADPAGFLICSFWLVGCLALAGERDEAGHLFERLAGRANDLGLFSEQVDPRNGAALGNFPQAFSHIGLINAAGGLGDLDAGHRELPPGPTRRIPWNSGA